MSQSSKPLKVLIHHWEATGHLNACLGFSQALLSRGHTVTALIDESQAGSYTKYGIREIHLTRPSPPQAAETNGESENPVKVMAEMLFEICLNDKSSLEKLKGEMPSEDNFATLIYRSTVHWNAQIEEILKTGKPDVIIVDTFLIAPAILGSGIPWVYLYSSNPLGLFNVGGDRLPPYGSGYPTNSDPATWSEFHELVNSVLRDSFQEQQLKLYQTLNYTPTEHESKIESGIFFLLSPYLNLYGFPRELDYTDRLSLPKNTFQVDAFCREPLPSSVEPLKAPEGFLERENPEQKFIYLSLGSMGSIDIDVMQRIVAILSRTAQKVIVSKGFRSEEYSLPGNAWGEAYLPQTAVLAVADLVITHGGNNTTTETFRYGRPMIVMPLFSDQYDNAQRVEEKGFGIRLNPYKFKDEELLEAVEKLLGDEELKKRLEKARKRIEEENRKVKAVEEIERRLEQEWKKKA